MNKSGFTIIELLFSLMVASFLVMTLTMILGQTNKARTFAQTEVHAALLKNSLITTLYQDFAGTILLEKHQAESEKTKTADKKEEEIPPIIIKRSSENIVEEIRFTSVSAVQYQQIPIPSDIIYSLVPADLTKKTYKIQRKITIKNQDHSKQKESDSIVFLENIVKCTAQLVKLPTKDKSADKTKNQEAFELIDQWEFAKKESADTKTSSFVKTSADRMADKEKQQINKEEKVADKNQPPKVSEQKKETKEPTIEIPFIKITIVYLKNAGAEEDFVLFIPLFIYKAEQSVSPKASSEAKNSDKQSSDAKALADEPKEIAKNPTVAQNRASKALESIFGGIK